MPVPAADRAERVPAQMLVLKFWPLHLPQLAIALVIDLYARLSTLLFLATGLQPRAPRRPTETGEPE